MPCSSAVAWSPFETSSDDEDEAAPASDEALGAGVQDEAAGVSAAAAAAASAANRASTSGSGAPGVEQLGAKTGSGWVTI